MTTDSASELEAGDNVAAPVNAGEVVAEKYLIERTLGVGGMGVVVAARDQLLDRRVAIKFLLPKLAGSDTAVQRFMREARAATRVSSEHVVRLLEIGKLPSGTPFFVMEYLEGSDLRALLRERGALSPSLAVDYALQALQAVAEGHIKGIVHRDIKPGNLFLTSRADGTALIKVLDFGIAKTLESDAAESTSLTSSDDVRLGSPAYMPPEQLQNPRDVDTRSDIWSLGATLYELLCGRPPFEGPGYLELASRILSAPPIPISHRPMPSPLPNGLEAILRKCLEKERASRYANAGELAAALAPFGSDDARMSLARVSGMLGSQSSIPALTRSVPQDGASCTTTLEAPSAPSAPTNSDERRTSDIGAVASTPPPHAARSWLIVAAAAVVIFGVFVLRRPVSMDRRASEARSARVEPPVVEVTAAPTPVMPAPVTLPPSPAVSAEPATAASPAVAVARVPSARTPEGKPPSPHVADASDPVRVAAPEAASSAQPAGDPAKALGAGSAAAETPSGPGLGRSEEIERLIQQRR